MCKVFAYQNPSMHFDSLYTSLHFVQQCLAPQQYVSCWLRFIALQTFLSSEKAPVGQIRCGPVGRQTAAQESCSNHFGMLLSVGLVVAVAAVSFFNFPKQVCCWCCNLAEIAVNEQEPLVEHFCARWFLRAVSVTHHSLLPTRQI